MLFLSEKKIDCVVPCYINIVIIDDIEKIKNIRNSKNPNIKCNIMIKPNRGRNCLWNYIKIS